METSARPAALPASEPVRLARSEMALLPTRHGNFRIVAFTEADTGLDNLAILSGDVEGCHGVLVRLHSECLTGDVLGSNRCDCGAQLDLALARIAEQGGVVLYLRQEGRGIGLANKIRAYHLQDNGLDTVDANLRLGFPADARSYAVAAEMLRALDVRCVRLMTNNPAKVQALADQGIQIVAREPHEIPANETNRAYLETKRDRLAHALRVDDAPPG